MRRVRDVERLRRFRDEADEALARLQPRAVHGVRLQALVAKSSWTAAARQIDRADVGDHGRRHHGDEPIQPLLRGAAVLP